MSDEAILESCCGDDFRAVKPESRKEPERERHSETKPPKNTSPSSLHPLSPRCVRMESVSFHPPGIDRQNVFPEPIREEIPMIGQK